MNKLEREALSKKPLAVEMVQAWYEKPDVLPGYTVRRLCESHERLRMELDGLSNLLDSIAGYPRVGAWAVPAGPAGPAGGWVWMVAFKTEPGGGLQESGIAANAKEAAAAMRQGINNLAELGYWKD